MLPCFYSAVNLTFPLQVDEDLRGDLRKGHCAWKGKRGPLLALGLHRTLVHDLQHVDSVRFRELVLQLDSQRAGRLLRWRRQVCNISGEEIGKKLGAIWDHCPHKALGMFGYCQGASLQESKTCAAECVEEMDSHASISQAHPVTLLLFHSGSPLRQLVLEFARTPGTTLLDYPLLFVIVQEYALSSCVERAVERLHSLIHRMHLAAMTDVKPASACAFLRRHQHADLVQDQDFMKFAEQTWFKKGLTAELLSHLLEPQQISSLSEAERLARIYQYSLHDQYQVESEAKTVHDSWDGVYKMNRAQPTIVVTPMASLALEFFKSKLEASRCFSVPVRLWKVSLGDQVPAPSAQDLLDTLAPPPCIASCDALVGGHVFFEVINPRPERSFIASPLHVVKSKSEVQVAVLNMQLRDGRPVFRRDVATRGESLDVLPWCLPHVFAEVLKHLMVWSCAADERVLEPSRSAGEDVLPGLDAPLMPNILDNDDPPEAIVAYSPGAGPGGNYAESFSPQEKDFLATLMHSQAFDTSFKYVEWECLDNVPVDLVDSLVHRKIISTKTDEFGSLQLALSTRHVQLSALTTLYGDPVPLGSHSRGFGDESKLCKLELVQHLLQIGWCEESSPVPLSRHAALVFRGDLKRPREYFLALAHCDLIWAKPNGGHLLILHDRPQNYYRALLRLDDLMPLLAIADAPDYKDEDYKKLVLDSGELVEAGEDLDADGLALPLPGPAPALPLVVPMEAMPARPAQHAHARGAHITVNFDNFSHSSGEQRMFTECRHDGHGVCIKYRQVIGFPSPEAGVQWMVAWRLAAHRFPNKAEHLKGAPTEAELAEAASALAA